jgi:hypothetical protein
MKCLSCQVDIDPKWKHAIDNNVCPFCGDHIIPEDLKNNIISLREVISCFKEKYSEQLDDLLFSNYNYVRTDSPRMKQFIPEPKVIYRTSKKSEPVEDSSEDTDTEQFEEDHVTVQDPEVTSKFFKNAEASKAVARTSELKKLVSEIKRNNPEIAKSIKANKDLEDYSEEYEDVNSSMNSYDDDDQIPAAVLAFANQSKNKASHDYNPKDMIKLQQLQQRVSQSRKNMINGTGGKGSFSRG